MSKAITFETTGGPEVLRWTEVEVGEPDEGRVRLRHTAVGLNYIDTYHRRGLYPLELPSGKIEDLNDADLEIVYTSASPSEFLLDLTIADFDLDELAAGDRWRVEAEGSRD